MRTTIVAILTALLAAGAAAAQTGAPAGLSSKNEPVLHGLDKVNPAATFASSGRSQVGPALADRLSMPITDNKGATLSVSAFQGSASTFEGAGKDLTAQGGTFNVRREEADRLPALAAVQTMSVQRDLAAAEADQALALPIRP